jgi:predicted HicB family RNase H-like nuclease
MFFRMIVSGKRQLFYTDNLLVKIDPALRAELAAAAERERLSMSELVRRNIRAALAGQSQQSTSEAGCAK